MDDDGTILECTGNLEPQVGGEECVIPSPNCQDFDDDDITFCDICNPSLHFLDENDLCVHCNTLDDDCTGVTNLGNITSCTTPLLPSADKQSCVQRSLNC